MKQQQHGIPSHLLGYRFRQPQRGSCRIKSEAPS
jgi:hypothetical protein